MTSKLSQIMLATMEYTSKTSAYTLQEDDAVVFCNGTFTVTLPNAANYAGQIWYVKNTGTGIITLSASQNIDGAASLNLTSYDAVFVMSDGTQYWIL